MQTAAHLNPSKTASGTKSFAGTPQTTFTTVTNTKTTHKTEPWTRSIRNSVLVVL